MSEKENIIQLWIENKVANIEFEFDCGGDSMGDTVLNILDAKGMGIECKEIEDYFENEIYNNVEFYVNSDGHYQGENGTVYVYLNDEKNNFDYSKSSSEHYEEMEEFEEFVPLTEEEINYINLYVSNINTSWGSAINFNYKSDFIKTDKHEELEKSIGEKISQFWNDYKPDVVGELNDGQDESWNTNEDDKILETNGTNLKVILHYWTNIYKESE